MGSAPCLGHPAALTRGLGRPATIAKDRGLGAHGGLLLRRAHFPVGIAARADGFLHLGDSVAGGVPKVVEAPLPLAAEFLGGLAQPARELG